MNPLLAVPLITILLVRAYANASLTPLGLLTALVTALAHACHPWSVFFGLLAVFYLGGTAVTRVKHGAKARLTVASSGAAAGKGGSGGGAGRPPPRTHVQVLANSLVASVLVVGHAWRVSGREGGGCWERRGDLLVVGIVW